MEAANEINHILKWFEFRARYPDLEDKLSIEYRKYIYKIAKNESVNINPAQLKQIEEKFQKEYHTKVDEYRQNISYSTIIRVERNIDEIGKEKSAVSVLSQYSILDELLSKLEHYIDLAAIEWDKRVQREIDLSRGK